MVDLNFLLVDPFGYLPGQYNSKFKWREEIHILLSEAFILDRKWWRQRGRYLDSLISCTLILSFTKLKLVFAITFPSPSDFVSEGSLCSCIDPIPTPDDVTPDDEDVVAEETVVKQQTAQDATDLNVAVQMRGLTKTYPGAMNIGCCKCRKTPPYHAVKV